MPSSVGCLLSRVLFLFFKLTICSDVISIPEPRDCVWCCLKRYICSSVPHTNLCSCPSCHTHQPCYQPNTQGASGLDGKPGSRVSQYLILLQHVLWLWICASGQTLLPHVLPSRDEGDIRLEWKEKVYKDVVQKGKVGRTEAAALIDSQPKLQDILRKPQFRAGKLARWQEWPVWLASLS